MEKILITPVESSGIKPFMVEGELKRRITPDGIVFEINGASYPAEIVTVVESADNEVPA